MALPHHPAPPGRMHGAEPCASCGARHHSVCDAVEDSDMQRLAAVATLSHTAPGRTFITEGEVADTFFDVTAGTARLFKSLPDGRCQITGFAGRGAFLGLAATDHYAFSAEAIGPLHYCRFSRRRLRTLLDDVPALERRLLASAANELVAAQEQMLLLGRKTALERVASFLLARSQLDPPCPGPAQTLHLPMTRSDIAEYLGLRIETVSRMLTRLKLAHVIALPSASEIVIRNRPALSAQAGAPAPADRRFDLDQRTAAAADG